ncbi:MAG: 2-oxoacid:acceptor oxidoreductase family protein [Spirochaetaceae bacterium]|jgi:2-oxoglutarate ferredoxin oxidoreductase subunit gamma|nr:2-oxoacid:acceptor oxidoreductase family protein [Spirochaetaceae bacterium]
MTEEIIVAGFGGQGVLLAGKMLAVAAMRQGKHVSHIPSYGAEMRGGTANCSVVISDEEIASPTIEHPSVLIVLNEPSLKKFEKTMAPGGLLLVNTTLIKAKAEREDIKVVYQDFTDFAREAGSDKSANMAALGCLIKEKNFICSLEALINALDEAVSQRNRRFNTIN